LIEVTPPKYHIFIDYENDKEKSGIRFNVTEEELMRTFVLPFNEGKPFWFGGRLLSPSKVKRAVIFWSSEDCNKLVLPNGEGVTSCKDKNHVIESVCLGKVKGVHLCTEKFLISDRKTEESQGSASRVVPSGRRRVHIIHGKDEAMKQAVSQILEQIALVPVILHEQPNQGRTLLGEFSEYSDVTFVLVLLSPDEICSAVPRASQNVILELGYFLGKLGRRNVLPLYRETKGFDLPVDIVGVGYAKFDLEGTWKFKLAKSLQDSGYDVDISKIR
jgi:predicted nucleotide-binding protein